ncbi:MAG TPA: hypothetical protein VE988_23505 [Gemmataceae bacterium]|nr:hypothetical protein [Gemmataceae bacterium]
MATVTKTRNVHSQSLATSTAIAGYYVMNFIPPLHIIRVLNKANVRFMLAGAHGIGGYLDETRATQDVDVVVGYRQHQKATRALLAAYPHLKADDQEVVVRLRDPESGKVLIDVMKATQPLFKEALKHTRTIVAEGESYKIPSLEMALAMKFGPMVSPNRADSKKLQDAADFTSIVVGHPEIDLEKLAELSELVYPGGEREVIELVRKIRAGERLRI